MLPTLSQNLTPKEVFETTAQINREVERAEIGWRILQKNQTSKRALDA